MSQFTVISESWVEVWKNHGELYALIGAPCRGLYLVLEGVQNMKAGYLESFRKNLITGKPFNVKPKKGLRVASDQSSGESIIDLMRKIRSGGRQVAQCVPICDSEWKFFYPDTFDETTNRLLGLKSILPCFQLLVSTGSMLSKQERRDLDSVEIWISSNGQFCVDIEDHENNWSFSVPLTDIIGRMTGTSLQCMRSLIDAELKKRQD